MCIACGPLMDALNANLAKTSRRLFLKGGGAALAAGFAGGVGSFMCGDADAETATGDTLYSGGAVLTMTDAMPTAEAVLVRAGRIVSVGKLADVEVAAEAPVTKVDLAGRALLPGFFDPHAHVVMIGLQALSANLLPAPDGEGNDIAAI
jgi:imidazolonepropionase-like amidohydrolase